MITKYRVLEFLVCGVQKGGTSALDSYLREHPQVCMADEKELHFFDREKYFVKGKPPYRKYHKHFAAAQGGQIRGEATPVYTYWLPALRRIWEYNPKIRLLVLLRNPVERAYSHWNMECSRGKERLSFLEAIQNERSRCREKLPLQHRRYSYVDRGFYSEQLRRIWSYFPEEQVLIEKTENLRDQPQQVLDKVCDFLGIEQFKNVKRRIVHSQAYEARMSAVEKAILLDIYENEIRQLERMLGWDCADWLT